VHAVTRLLAAGLLAAGLSGCSAGLLYTNIVRPLDLNVETAAEQPATGRSDWKTFAYVVQVDWDTAAIAKAARDAGITNIHYADMQIFSVLGIWRQRTAIVYGTGP
jgi:hypothetical protein